MDENDYKGVTCEGGEERVGLHWDWYWESMGTVLFSYYHFLLSINTIILISVLYQIIHKYYSLTSFRYCFGHLTFGISAE